MKRFEEAVCSLPSGAVLVQRNPVSSLGTKRFGRVWLEDGRWCLDVEPHVALKLKRVFARVSLKAHGTIRLTDTVEVCRDLAWFMERYPLEIGVLDRARMQAEAQKFFERESLLESLLSGVRAARAFKLALEPREYQRVAAEICLASGGLLVADDVGLGKTCTGICVLSESDALPALVVTLTHLPKQWENEIRKFAPWLTTHILTSGTPYDLRKVRVQRNGQMRIHGETPDVIISNYHKLAGWADTLAGVVKSVAFDEAQELRRPSSAKYAAAVHVARSANYRIGLTATPIYNYGDEIYWVLDALRPGVLGSRDEFLTEWCTTPTAMGKTRVVQPGAFGTYLRDMGLMLRRTRHEVHRELPEVVRVPHFIEADTRELDRIEGAATQLARIILSQNPQGKGEKWKAAEELSYLVRQATGIAKAPYVADFVRLLVESGERVVLYGWHREVYGIWMERLSSFRPAMYTGSESPTQKEESKRRFVEGETPILMISLRSGAGLDGLQECARTVVFGELDWSPGVHEQCIGRVHRDGQGEPVTAYFLLADNGSDPVIADVLGLKEIQATGIRDPNAPLIERLQVDEDHVKRLAARYIEENGRQD